jgi:predicted  nucleic acid-binding Zn-ribbon protein
MEFGRFAVILDPNDHLPGSGMNSPRRIRLALTAIAIALCGLILNDTANSQPPGFPRPPGFPGAPNIPGPPNGIGGGGIGGMPGRPPGMPQMPGPGIPEMPGIPTQEWRCDKCNHLVGTGPFKPHVANCPNCGVRFNNTPEGRMEDMRDRMKEMQTPVPQFPQNNFAPAPAPMPVVQEREKNFGAWGMIVGIAVFVILVAGGIILAVVMSSKPKTAKRRANGDGRRSRPASRSRSRDRNDDEDWDEDDEPRQRKRPSRKPRDTSDDD